MYCSVVERIRFSVISDSTLRIVGSSLTGQRFLTIPFFFFGFLEGNQDSVSKLQVGVLLECTVQYAGHACY